jgi:hypothetical protein
VLATDIALTEPCDITGIAGLSPLPIILTALLPVVAGLSPLGTDLTAFVDVVDLLGAVYELFVEENDLGALYDLLGELNDLPPPLLKLPPLAKTIPLNIKTTARTNTAILFISFLLFIFPLL